MPHNHKERMTSSPERNTNNNGSIAQMSNLLNPDEPGASEPWVRPRLSIFAGMPGLASVGVGLENTDLTHRPDMPGANTNIRGDQAAEGREGTSGVGADEREPDRNNSPQNWGDMKTKAGKDRKRLPLACIACRRKKIRCSGEKPACKHCVRARLPCVYKQSARKFTPRTDYMATLDKRMKRMEERLLKYTSKEAAASLGPIARSIVKPGPATQQAGPEPAKAGRKRSADRAFGDLSAARDTFISDIAARKALGEVNEDILEEGKDMLPSEEIQEHLAEVFFDCAYGQTYLLLHKPSFMRRLREGTVPPVLILGVCALAARFSNHPEVKHDPPYLAGQEWGLEAGRLVLKNFDKANLTNLTVCILLGLHEFGTCNGGKSWYFGGMAVRMAHALELHKEADHNPLGLGLSGGSNEETKSKSLSFTDREIRRRLMWSCFLMDRFNSSGTFRPQLLLESDIEIQLPVRERMFILERPGLTEGLDGVVRDTKTGRPEENGDPRNNMGVAAYTLKVIALYGRVMKYLNLGGKDRDPNPIWYPNSQFSELDNQIHELKESFPPHMQYTLENLNIHAAEKLEGQFMFLHIAWHQILLFLHRYSIPIKPGAKPPADIPVEFLRSSVQTSFKAANTIATIFSDADKRQYGIYAPFMGYTSFAAATVHVVGSFSKNSTIMSTAKHNLTACVNYLTKMANYWGVLIPLWESLKEQYEQHSKATNTPGRMDLEIEDEDSSNILQYGDWFQKYPRGVDKSDKKDTGDSSNSSSRGHSGDEGDGAVHDRTKSDKVSVDPVMRKGADLVTPENFLKKLQQDRVRSPPGGTATKTAANKRQASKSSVLPHQSHNRSASTSKNSPKRDERQKAVLRGHGPDMGLAGVTDLNRSQTLAAHTAANKPLHAPFSSATAEWSVGPNADQARLPNPVAPPAFPAAPSQPSAFPVEAGGYVSYPSYLPPPGGRPPAPPAQLSDATGVSQQQYMVDSYPYESPPYGPSGASEKHYPGQTGAIGSSSLGYNANALGEAFSGGSLAESNDRVLPDADGLFASQSAWFLPFNYSPPGSNMELQSLGLQQMIDEASAASAESSIHGQSANTYIP